ncbi:hypothetical protein [Paenibacillus sp. HW567]|uniref:hypothetical protein n=1 Tax=Paenibacillus sp. HW567 TaxID=1034769 RepID=UPI0003736119|nr:hypothetical protein [Paenibacillus sp. HW567]
MSQPHVLTDKKVLWMSVCGIFLLLVIMAVVLLYPGQQRVHFKTGETSFVVDVPKGWTVVQKPRQAGNANIEASPDEGVELLLAGDERNSIRIYAQYGTIGQPEAGFVKEQFSTKQGVQGALYKDQEDGNWQLILEQAIAPGFYGAAVRFEDKAMLDKNQQKLVQILKSIRIIKL